MTAPSRRAERAARSIALLSGLVLFVFAAGELANSAVGLVSLETMGNVAAWRMALTRSWAGTTIIAAAAMGHAATTMWLLTRRATLRMPMWDAAQIVSGLLVPLFLMPYIVDTRGGAALFDVADDTLYRLARLWPEHAFAYILLIGLLWGHGCLGFHRWLRLRPGYRTVAPVLAVAALALPIATIAGLISAANVVSVLMADGPFSDRVRAATRWPSADAEITLSWIRLAAVSLYGLVIVVILGVLTIRFLRIVVAPKIDVIYTNGPPLRVSIGPTLLEISRINAVPHSEECGGRGRCTACRVRIEDGASSLPSRTAAENAMLGEDDLTIRLACQFAPVTALTVTRLGHTADATETEPELDGSGLEKSVTALCVNLSDYDRIIGARPAYDAIFLLNEFLDAVHGSIAQFNGWMVRVTDRGLVVVFGQDDPAAAACRSAIGAAGAIDAAMDRLNERFAAEFGQPLSVAMGVAYGRAFLGRIGVGTKKQHTAIGPAVTMACEFATEAQTLRTQLVADPDVFRTGGIDASASTRLYVVGGTENSREVMAIDRARSVRVDHTSLKRI